MRRPAGSIGDTFRNAHPALRPEGSRRRRSSTSASIAASSAAGSPAGSDKSAPVMKTSSGIELLRYPQTTCAPSCRNGEPSSRKPVTSAVNPPMSAPEAPAFMRSAPPSVPGIPASGASPAKPASAALRASSGSRMNAPARSFPSSFSAPENPAFESRSPSFGHGSSIPARFVPPPRMNTGIPAEAVNFKTAASSFSSAISAR